MPSTIWPPLQSLFLAAIYAIAGVHIAAVQLVQTLLLHRLRACCCAASGDASAAASRRRTSRPRCSSLNPANAAYAQWLWPEVHAPLSRAARVLAAAERRDSRIAFDARRRVVSGLALLAKSLLAAFLAGVPDRVRAHARAPRFAHAGRCCSCSARARRPRRRSGTAVARTAGR